MPPLFDLAQVVTLYPAPSVLTSPKISYLVLVFLLRRSRVSSRFTNYLCISVFRSLNLRLRRGCELNLQFATSLRTRSRTSGLRSSEPRTSRTKDSAPTLPTLKKTLEASDFSSAASKLRTSHLRSLGVRTLVPHKSGALNFKFRIRSGTATSPSPSPSSPRPGLASTSALRSPLSSPGPSSLRRGPRITSSFRSRASRVPLDTRSRKIPPFPHRPRLISTSPPRPLLSFSGPGLLRQVPRGTSSKLPVLHSWVPLNASPPLPLKLVGPPLNFSGSPPPPSDLRLRPG